MVFVFSLEDEISFQTVYNYFLRLCSFRNASEVPMVLVGTQGERAHGAGTGEGWSRVPPLSVLPESWCHPRTGSASLPCARTLDLPQLDPPTCVTIAPVSFETREQSSWLISPLSWWQGWSKAWRPLRLCSVSPAVSAPRPPALCPNDPPRPWHLLLSRLSKFPPSRLRQTPSVPQTPGSSTTAGPASCPRT